MKFIYVMNDKDKDTMLAMGYTLLKENKKNKVYVFANKDTAVFSDSLDIDKANISYVLSDTIAF